MMDIEKKRLLVVDDFDLMRRTIREMLVSFGYEQITVVTNGSEAKEYISSNSVDCILSDWNMPEVTGLDLLRYVRSTDGLRETPFILVTAEVSRESVNSAILEGVNEFIAKPFSPGGLKEKLDWVLAHPGQKIIDRRPAPAPGKAAPAESKPKQLDRHSVLIVDDVATNIDVIAGILSKNYEIKIATNGEKALQIAGATPVPDLILLDIMMPGMDGMEVCRRLKQDRATEGIPVIFLTAMSDANDVASGLELGAVDYITKPANPTILKARVNTHLQLSKSRDELKDQIDTLVENAQLREDVERMTRHDLKNPLAAIISRSTTLLDDIRIGMVQKEEITEIRSASYEMLSMINRSLDLYKMETGTYQFQPEPVDIVAVTQSVVKESRINANEYGVSIFFDAPQACLCEGEELLCYSMLSNLVRNAVEASPKQGEVKVVIQCEGGVSVSIHNQGAVPPEIRDSLFEKYVTAGKAGGTGLGAYSAKLMTETQGGSIDVETSDQAVTTFTVRLNPAKG
ncbi:MAG: response regulator [Candidatus Sedimenticola sp. (ex Thyasira tokunagai)]